MQICQLAGGQSLRLCISHLLPRNVEAAGPWPQVEPHGHAPPRSHTWVYTHELNYIRLFATSWTVAPKAHTLELCSNSWVPLSALSSTPLLFSCPFGTASQILSSWGGGWWLCLRKCDINSNSRPFVPLTGLTGFKIKDSPLQTRFDEQLRFIYKWHLYCLLA